jgi:hypothetical protein
MGLEDRFFDVTLIFVAWEVILRGVSMILFAGKMLKVETRWHTGW